MIELLKRKLSVGIGYVRRHPNLLVILGVILLLPLLLWYTNQQYLAAGLQNQERLQKDRIGLMHDVLYSLLNATDFDPAIAQAEIERIATQNPDIKEFRVAKMIGRDVVPIAALDSKVVGQPEENPQFYTNALVRVDESLIFPASEAEGRQWYTYRAALTEEGDTYFIYTKLSLAAVDTAFANNTRSANWSFVYVYIFIALLALWHVKMTDYRYLYTETKKMNEMKDLFTNTIAHELRSPLTAMRGYSSMIAESVEGEPREYARRVGESTERLIAIVNDLLDVARVQSGKLKIKKEVTNIGAIITKVVEELSVSAKEKSITLATTGLEDRHEAPIDPKRFHQALTNLISNAIKYTKEGSITVSLEDKKDALELRVKDTGMGIASGDQQKLFAPFFRVESADVSQITGTGLGMWITKQMIELMGGTIAVESIKGVGTHVVVILPKK